MPTESITELRTAIADVHEGRSSQRRRYPVSLRLKIVAHVTSERSKGVSPRATAKTLGLSYPTLMGWLKNQLKRFRSVAVKPASRPAESATLLLVTPQGHRIEGLDRETVAFLLRSLG